MALSKDFDTKVKADNRYAYAGPIPIAASQLLYQGALVGYDSDGRLVECTAANGVHAAGVARKQYDNSSGAAAALECEIEYGVHRLANSGGGNALVQADVGKPCFIYDDNTVGKFSATAGGVAGIVQEIKGSYVYVDIQPVDWANQEFDHDFLSEEVEDAATGVAVGITRYTVAGTDASAVPAGRYIGQRKRLVCIAASATPALTITPAAVSGFVAITMDAAGEFAEIRWNGSAWVIVAIGAATITWS